MCDRKYLGEQLVKLTGTPFSGFTTIEWALYFIAQYGWIDGAHHKEWVLDQVVRVLHNTPSIVKLAKWDDGTQEYRVELSAATSEYTNWVAELKDGEDGPDSYSYSTGSAP